jgi:putative ABC transport system permease protein
MDIGPILSALRRNPTGAILVALQIALTLAVVVNSLFIIGQRLERLNRDSGLDLPNQFAITWVPAGKSFNGEVAMREDLELLRGLPGVKAATATNALPLSGGGSASQYYTEPGEKGRESNGGYYQVDEHGLATFGVRLVEGRNFAPETIRRLPRASSEFVPEVIVTRAFAEAMFPGKPALGQQIYDGLGQSARVVGVIATMSNSWPTWDEYDRVLLHPQFADPSAGLYLVRTEPGQRDRVMREAEDRLAANDNGRVIVRVRSMETIAARTLADDRAMAAFLGVLIVLLLAIAALGVFGLASFNVGTRTRQIGTRRAVGARRVDILRHFLLENWLVSTIGVLAGCVLALALGYWLSTSFELPRLKLYHLLAGVVLLWTIALAAAFHPARRAASVSPAIATRTI